jgi:hypothetical protein
MASGRTEFTPGTALFGCLLACETWSGCFRGLALIQGTHRSAVPHHRWVDRRARGRNHPGKTSRGDRRCQRSQAVQGPGADREIHAAKGSGGRQRRDRAPPGHRGALLTSDARGIGLVAGGEGHSREPAGNHQGAQGCRERWGPGQASGKGSEEGTRDGAGRCRSGGGRRSRRAPHIITLADRRSRRAADANRRRGRLLYGRRSRPPPASARRPGSPARATPLARWAAAVRSEVIRDHSQRERAGRRDAGTVWSALSGQGNTSKCALRDPAAAMPTIARAGYEGVAGVSTPTVPTRSC